MTRRFTIGLATVFFVASKLNAQGTACPAKPGLYAKVASAWTEIPREANPVTTYKPNYLSPALPKINKEFAGDKAFITLKIPLELCVVGPTVNSTFSLEKATVKKGTRTIVQIGNFHDNKGSQSQAMASITDEEGSIRLLTNGLTSGQYIFIMLGGFKPMPKAPTGNTQTDATAAIMESSAAMVASIQAGNQGINFGIGID